MSLSHELDQDKVQDPCGVLFVDIEGGWGGSSRSLYYLIRHLDKERFRPVVILGKKGPMEERYASEGIPAFVFSPIPRTTAMERGNLKATGLFVLRWIHLPRLLLLLRKILRLHRVRIIHFNHESLFFLALLCRYLFRLPAVFHVRTMLPPNSWSRIQIRAALHSSDHVVFITENERDLWHRMTPDAPKRRQSVVYNIAETVVHGKCGAGLVDLEARFKVASLMTISRRRGTDRLVDVAQCLKQRGERGIVFVVCGKGEDSCEVEMKARIAREGLEDYFLFMGHQANPEGILLDCQALIKPSRENNPWGRDIIEAICLGRPVLAIGAYNTFIEDGVNGYLFPEFDAERMADKIVFLAENPQAVREMNAANLCKAGRYFDGPANAGKVACIYRELLSSPDLMPLSPAK